MNIKSFFKLRSLGRSICWSVLVLCPLGFPAAAQDFVDLELLGLDLVSPITFFRGDHPERIEYTIRNGNRPISTVELAIYISTDEIFSEEKDLLIGKRTPNLSMSAGEIASFVTENNLGIAAYTINPAASGMYYVFMKLALPTGGTITDTNSANNVAQLPYPIIVKDPLPNAADLLLLEVVDSQPSIIDPGASLTEFEFKMVNKGPESIGTSANQQDDLEITLFLSRNDTFGDGDDLRLGSTLEAFYLPPFASAQTTLFTPALEPFLIPEQASGDYYLFAELNIPQNSNRQDPRHENNVAKLDKKITVNGRGPPLIEAHPATQKIPTEGTAVFSVIARGKSPLSFQWQFNGTDIPNGTGPTLILSSINPSAAGQYRVRVTNSEGTILSDPAELQVGEKSKGVDLELIDFQLMLPVDSFPAEHPDTIQLTLANRGPGRIGSEIFIPPNTRIPNYANVPLALYLSRNRVFGDADDISIGGASALVQMDPEDVVNHTLIDKVGFPDLQIPSDATGKYEVFLVVSPPTGFYDPDPENNVARLVYPIEIPPRVTLSTADLVLTDFGEFRPGSITAGTSPTNVTITIGNKGFESLGASEERPAEIGLRFFLTKNNLLGDNDDRFIGEIKRSIFLRPQASSGIILTETERQSIDIPLDAVGDYQIFAEIVLGSGSKLIDPRSNNNRDRLSSSIKVLPPTAPVVVLTRDPNPDQVPFFTPPANFNLNAIVINSDQIDRVEFYQRNQSQPNQLLATARTGPFTTPVAALVPGVFTYFARAVLSNGTQVDSNLLDVNVPGAKPGFRFAVAEILVSERDTNVTITILKTNFGPATVTVATRDTPEPGADSARADPGTDYEPLIHEVAFEPGQLTNTVTIRLFNDLESESDEELTVLLRNPTNGATIETPSILKITIVDDDRVAVPFLDPGTVGAEPAHSGKLGVSLLFGNDVRNGHWRFAGELQWRGSETNATGLIEGDYPIEFKPVPGFKTPAPITYSGLAGIVNQLIVRYEPAESGPASGTALVRIEPVGVGGRWKFIDEDDSRFRESGSLAPNLVPGPYIVVFSHIDKRVTPQNRTMNVTANQTNLITATYFQQSSSTGAKPQAIRSFSDVLNPPFSYVGQVRTAFGEGSGFVVKEKVVLTAAHVIVPEVSLIRAGTIRWLLERHATGKPEDNFEPPGQLARGSFELRGYADGRRSENTPGLFSPASRDRDVAALFFYEPAGRGGFSGYLVSDEASQNKYLVSSRQKTMAGYPVEIVEGITPGVMHHASDSILFPFKFYPLEGSLYTYFSKDFFSLKGNSGGPLFVQLERERFRDPRDGFFPAAIYLGGGSELAIVRAIDSAVVNLIRRAEIAGNSGGGSGTGGVPQPLEKGKGKIIVTLLPDLAIKAGARWKVRGETEFSQDLISPELPEGEYWIDFEAPENLATPSSRRVLINKDQDTWIEETFGKSAPVPQVVLESATTVTGPYAPESNVTVINDASGNSIRVRTSDRVRFYRIRTTAPSAVTLRISSIRIEALDLVLIYQLTVN